MRHGEYKKAAMRHLSTCDILLKSIEATKTEEKQKIIYNIYYLSGYIIETSLNYAFFCLVNHKGEIETHPSYTSNGIKNHKFDSKIKFIKDNYGDLSGLPFISTSPQNGNLYKLYRNWSTDLRYYVSTDKIIINEKIIENFIAEIKKFSTIILKRF